MGWTLLSAQFRAEPLRRASFKPVSDSELVSFFPGFALFSCAFLWPPNSKICDPITIFCLLKLCVLTSIPHFFPRAPATTMEQYHCRTTQSGLHIHAMQGSFIVPHSSTDCLYKLLIPKARETGTAGGDNTTNWLLYSNLRSTGKDLLIKADDYYYKKSFKRFWEVPSIPLQKFPFSATLSQSMYFSSMFLKQE